MPQSLQSSDMRHWCCQEYESIYKAKAAIASHPQQRLFSVRRKRSDEDDEDQVQRYGTFLKWSFLC